jgi:N-acyl-D-amino-acid deacylase
MRSEGDRLLESISEVIRIGRDTGVRVHISHVKTAGISNWHKAEKAIGLMENARSSGTELTCDRYPYIASSTDLDAIFPQWMFDGGNDMEIRRLSDPETRRRLRAELTVQAADSSYWDRIVISSVAGTERRWMEGMTVTEISRKKMTDEIETVMDILADERLRVGAVFFSMNEENLKKFLLLPYCAVGSDSSARCLEGPTRLGKPHPRTFGTFPRFIREYVLGSGLMSLPEAVRRMTMLPASIFGIEGRGCIREGMFADLTVIDQDRIRDAATFSDPYRTSEGICHVLVNGIAVLTEGVPTDRLPGRMI